LSFNTHLANPFALNAIVQASEQYHVVASRDILDIRGIKLWASGQQVSAALSERLRARKLMRPLEVCLRADDGVTPLILRDQLEQTLQSDDALAQLLRPHAKTLSEQLLHLPVHSVVQLILTATLASQEGSLEHAVDAMALAGAMCAQRKRPVSEIRLSMLAGLIHDIGELYIDPSLLIDPKPGDFVGYRQTALHPRFAQLVLETTTDYPQNVVRAVAEHHERLDGSGYPGRVVVPDISPMGRILSIAESSLEVLRTPSDTPLADINFALRLIPGEFDLDWACLQFETSKRLHLANSALTASGASELEPALSHLVALRQRLTNATQIAHDLRMGTLGLRALDIAVTAIDRMNRLNAALNSMGFWTHRLDHLSALDATELRQAAREIDLRIHQLRRDCMLLSQGLEPADAAKLMLLCAELTS
jgi:hypothetical protein